MLQECIKKLVLGEDLSFQESYESMNEILDGKSSPVQNTARGVIKKRFISAFKFYLT